MSGLNLRTHGLKPSAIIEASTMLYKVDFDRDLNYVCLSVRGAMNLSETRVCRGKLHEFLLAYNRSRILVDTANVIVKLSASEDYKLINELRQVIPSYVSIALIVSRNRVPLGRFIETVAINNGIRLRTFTHKNEAAAWLMKQP